jgi:hypothetical protein
LGVFGTVRYMVFFVMCIKTRAVQIAGVRIAPDGDWMKQIARNLLDPVHGFHAKREPSRAHSGAESELQSACGAVREDDPDRVLGPLCAPTARKGGHHGRLEAALLHKSACAG